MLALLCYNNKRGIYMKILIVEDNSIIRDGLVFYLTNEGFEVESCSLIEEAILKIKDIDLAILDISLPDGVGFDLCKTIKSSSNKPVIFLTARETDEDIETGLTLADDYITKPFRNKELLLRINNLLNRKELTNVINIKDIEIDTKKGQISRNGEEINLTALEYKLFLLLAKNKNQVIETDYLLDYIYDLTGNYVEDNTLRVYIKRIREKIGTDVIKTIKGVGYKIYGD